MDPQNEREHESTPAAELVEQLTHLAVESCFHPSDGATKRLIDIKVEIIRRLSYAAAGEPYSVPAPFIGNAHEYNSAMPARIEGSSANASAAGLYKTEEIAQVLKAMPGDDARPPELTHEELQAVTAFDDSMDAIKGYVAYPPTRPSAAEVKATVFPEETAPEEPKQAKAKKSK